MTVKNAEAVAIRRDIGPSRRAVEMEFEVPGTPEQVWHAIATGPGISSWLFPTEVEQRVGGAVAFHIAPGMESAGVVTAFDPPRRFAYEEPEWNPPAPPLATEFIVEARAGGTCVVRLVHSLFTSNEDWDDQFDGFEAGWVSFFDVLRMYLRHFSGMPCSPIRLMSSLGASTTEGEAWKGAGGRARVEGFGEGEPSADVRAWRADAGGRRRAGRPSEAYLRGDAPSRRALAGHRARGRLRVGRKRPRGDQLVSVWGGRGRRDCARRARLEGVDGAALSSAAL